MTFIFKKRPSEDVNKTMLKAWDFTANKLCLKCFDNNLQLAESFPKKKKKIETGTREMLLIVLLIIG